MLHLLPAGLADQNGFHCIINEKGLHVWSEIDQVCHFERQMAKTDFLSCVLSRLWPIMYSQAEEVYSLTIWKYQINWISSLILTLSIFILIFQNWHHVLLWNKLDCGWNVCNYKCSPQLHIFLMRYHSIKPTKELLDLKWEAENHRHFI